MSKSKTQLKISVIIPVYNRSNSVIRTINSVLDQDYTNFEIIVIDDGSTDLIDDAMAQINDSRIIYLKCSENKGVSAARNYGLQSSSGDAICFLDSDDVFKQDYLTKMVSEMKMRNAQVVACLARFTDNQILPNRVQRANYRGSKDKFGFLLRGNIFPLPCLLFSSDLKSQLSFNEHYKSYEDYAMLLKLHSKQLFDRYTFLPEALVNVNDSLDGINKNYQNILATLYDIQNVYSKVLADNDTKAYNYARNVIGIEKRAGMNTLLSRRLFTIIYSQISLRRFLYVIGFGSRT